MRKKLMFIAIVVLFICSACDSERDLPYKVVLDPGHGGVDVGAVGASGSFEKDFNLSVALKVMALLELDSRIEVYLTRDDDSHLSRESKFRPKYANELGADLFISIHANAFPESHASGTETYYYRRKSRTLAQVLQEHVVGATGFNDREVKKKTLTVIKDTKMPAVLLEIGFLTNPEEEQIMLTDSFQDDVAQAIVDGIVEYLFDS